MIVNTTHEILLAYPILKYENPSLYSFIPSTYVDFIGPPSVMTNAEVKFCSAWMICMIRLKKMIEVICGIVIVKKMRILPAPSISAASYRDLGTCFNAARNMTIDEPNCQISREQIVFNAYFVSPRKDMVGAKNF